MFTGQIELLRTSDKEIFLIKIEIMANGYKKGQVSFNATTFQWKGCINPFLP